MVTNATDTHPTGCENLPKFQGPGLNVFLAVVNLSNVGNVNDMNAAMAPTEKIAPMVTSPAKSNKSNNSPMIILIVTAYMGVLVTGETRFHICDPGNNPSLE